MYLLPLKSMTLNSVWQGASLHTLTQGRHRRLARRKALKPIVRDRGATAWSGRSVVSSTESAAEYHSSRSVAAILICAVGYRMS